MGSTNTILHREESRVRRSQSQDEDVRESGSEGYGGAVGTGAYDSGGTREERGAEVAEYHEGVGGVEGSAVGGLARCA